MLVLGRADVEAALDLKELIEAVAEAMVELSAGRVSMPARIAAVVPEKRGLLAAMPAFLPASHALTTKLVSLFPENRDRPTHQAIICCFDPEYGTPLAVMDGEYITAMRTAAGSVLSAQLLARSGASTFAIIGTGVQAQAHARLIAAAYPNARILIAGRRADSAERLREQVAGLGIAAKVAPSIEDAVRAAGVVCAATHAAEPVVRYAWLRPGTHLTSVGYNTDGTGEIDAETLRHAFIAVESRPAALAEPPAGAVELRLAIEAGAITPEDVRAELGELVAGTAAGRTSDEQLTVYKSVGVAIQDAAAAALVLEAARQRGMGTTVAL